jgi:hypothetical protein
MSVSLLKEGAALRRARSRGAGALVVSGVAFDRSGAPSRLSKAGRLRNPPGGQFRFGQGNGRPGMNADIIKMPVFTKQCAVCVAVSSPELRFWP